MATVTALAATADLDDTFNIGEGPSLDSGPELLKPLSLDALRRSAMNMQGLYARRRARVVITN